jgi:hypothetical protein
VALFGAMAVGTFGTALDARMESMNIAPALRQVMDEQVPRLAETAAPRDADAATRLALKTAIDESFVRSFRLVMLTASGLAVASGLCAALTIGAPRRKT